MNESDNSHRVTIRLFLYQAAIFLAITVSLGSTRAANHPLDPLNAKEIVNAAQILLDGGAATPGAAFQSVELESHPKKPSWVFIRAIPWTAGRRSTSVRTSRVTETL